MDTTTKAANKGLTKDKILIIDDAGSERIASTPVIVSASRSTDIPAFYSDWLVERLKKGYVKWKNPFNGEYSYVSFAKTRLFVFWTKNPKPMMGKLDYLDEKHYNYYFQYTLNDYVQEKWENGLPTLDERISTFINLSTKIGKDKVIWRFDPIIISKALKPDDVIKRIQSLGDQLHSYTDRLVFSFIDVENYRKVKSNLSKLPVDIKELNRENMEYIAGEIACLNKKWNLKLGTCAESIDLNKYGIEHNRCIDDRLMLREFSDDTRLTKYLGYDSDQLECIGYTYDEKSYTKMKDKGQRKACGCINSKDIGQYDTCPHGCVYCYANSSHETALANWKYAATSTKDTIV
jgi:DNA repair photolyase